MPATSHRARTVRKTVALDPETWERFDRILTRKGLNAAEMLRLLVADCVSREEQAITANDHHHQIPTGNGAMAVDTHPP